MPGSTPNYLIPYPVSGDSLKDAVSTIPQAAATKIDEIVGTINGTGPSPSPLAAALVSCSGAVQVYKRGWLAIVVVDVTTTSAINQFWHFATLPVAASPAGVVNAQIWNNTSGASLPIYTNGRNIHVRNAVPTGHQLLGTVTVPL